MATKVTYTRIGNMVVEHKIEVPDAPAPAAAEPKPTRGRSKRETIEESPSSSDES